MSSLADEIREFAEEYIGEDNEPAYTTWMQCAAQIEEMERRLKALVKKDICCHLDCNACKAGDCMERPLCDALREWEARG